MDLVDGKSLVKYVVDLGDKIEIDSLKLFTTIATDQEIL